jgi:hypothetical protein
LAAGTLRSLVVLLVARQAALLAGGTSLGQGQEAGQQGGGVGARYCLYKAPAPVQLYLTAQVRGDRTAAMSIALQGRYVSCSN